MNPLDDEEDFGGEEENDYEEDIETENGAAAVVAKNRNRLESSLRTALRAFAG